MVKFTNKLFTEDDMSYASSQASSHSGGGTLAPSNTKKKSRRRCKSASDEPMRVNSTILPLTNKCIDEFKTNVEHETSFKVISSMA